MPSFRPRAALFSQQEFSPCNSASGDFNDDLTFCKEVEITVFKAGFGLQLAMSYTSYV